MESLNGFGAATRPAAAASENPFSHPLAGIRIPFLITQSLSASMLAGGGAGPPPRVSPLVCGARAALRVLPGPVSAVGPLASIRRRLRAIGGAPLPGGAFCGAPENQEKTGAVAMHFLRVVRQRFASVRCITRRNHYRCCHRHMLIAVMSSCNIPQH